MDKRVSYQAFGDLAGRKAVVASPVFWAGDNGENWSNAVSWATFFEGEGYDVRIKRYGPAEGQSATIYAQPVPKAAVASLTAV